VAAGELDAYQAIRDVLAARVVACDLARRLSEDAEKIAGLRAAVIKAAEDVRRRQAENSDKLAIAISAAENISPAGASAGAAALLEFARSADVLAATLQAQGGSRLTSALSMLGQGDEILRQFGEEFARTCEFAQLAARRNDSIAETLSSALAVVASA